MQKLLILSPMMTQINLQSQLATDLLCRLIAIPSLSHEEGQTADVIESFLKEAGCRTFRRGNNVWVRSVIDGVKPVILLNSHHDTVKPVAS